MDRSLLYVTIKQVSGFDSRKLKRVPSSRFSNLERNQLEAITDTEWDDLKNGQFWKINRFVLNEKFTFNERTLDKTRCHSIMWLNFIPKPYVARFKHLLMWRPPAEGTSTHVRTCSCACLTTTTTTQYY